MDSVRQRPQLAVRVLRVDIGARLSVTSRIEQTALKVLKMAKALHSSTKEVGHRTMQARIRLVQAVCRTTMDHACPALLPLSSRAEQALETVDRALFRLVFGEDDERMPSADALAQELGRLSTQHRWWRLAMRQVCKQLGADSYLGRQMRQRKA